MKENMDNIGEIELPSDVFRPNSDSSSNIQPSPSMDSFLDNFLRNSQTCTHTHMCNPPGPDAAHTHTCYHTHTQIIPSEDDTGPRDEKSPVSRARRPSGNREAVRKYREKKKAQVAYLEEEVKKLRSVNQQLMRKLQKQAILENEVSRLRGLLVDLRGKIDGQLGDFPFSKRCNTIGNFNDCGVRQTNVNELACGLTGGKVMDILNGNCQQASADCQANTNYVASAEKCLHDPLENLVPSAPREE